MTPTEAVFVMMNNYFHDVATAMPLACSVTMWLIIKKSEGASPLTGRGLRRFFNAMRWLVIFSWVWILSAGMLRIVTFRSFEWPHAVERSHEGGLILKYAVAAAIMTAGTYLWISVRKKMESGTAGEESDV